MSKLEEINENVIKGKAQKVAQLVKEALKENITPEMILQNSLIGAMAVVGEGMKKGTLFIPEVLLSARAMKFGLEVLKPVLQNAQAMKAGVVAIGTVKGDLHDIGKNLVCMMLESSGFEVIDLGIDVSTERFLQVVREKEPNILGLSTLLTTTMPAMAEVIRALEKAGLKKTVKVIVGGAPVNEAFSKQIGADGYARDAASAVEMVTAMVQ